jgi:3',5'-nucleoside bisphosphate phosphatase
MHTHSTASDGTDSPAELLRAAATAGLDVVAITDHDSTAGWAEAEQTLRELPGSMRLVRGMEMSCTGDGEDGSPVAVHLLAYLFDPANEAFAKERERLRGERVTRLRAMGEHLAADGYPIDIDEILATTGAAAGRPHLARALVAAGVVESVDAAFGHLLAYNGPYYVEKADTPLTAAVEMVGTAGGVSVLAHGRARTRGRLLSVEHIREIAAAGLSGLEVNHIDHAQPDRDMLAALADELGLVTTGASDYHGTNKTVRLGEFTTDPVQFDKLVAGATGVAVLSGGTR